MTCWFELPVFSRSVSVIDSNSLVRTQNVAASSSSVRNPGLYFLVGTVSALVVKLATAKRHEAHAESGTPPILHQSATRIDSRHAL